MPKLTNPSCSTLSQVSGTASPPKDDNDLLSDKLHVVTHDESSTLQKGQLGGDPIVLPPKGSLAADAWARPYLDGIVLDTRLFFCDSFSARLWGRNLSANRDKPWRCCGRTFPKGVPGNMQLNCAAVRGLSPGADPSWSEAASPGRQEGRDITISAALFFSCWLVLETWLKICWLSWSKKSDCFEYTTKFQRLGKSLNRFEELLN